MKQNFLLNSELAQHLYKSHAQTLPIIDYHNHLSATDIADDRRFENLYELWIEPDPYKHRAMRMCGVSEHYITGNASEEEKFAIWCEIFPKLAGSPLYQWSLMELEDILEIREIPNRENCKTILKHAENYMARNKVSAKSILEQYHAEYISPCASLLDDLTIYKTEPKMKPSLRGDNILSPDKAFISKLQELTSRNITDLETYLQAVEIRVKAFWDAGCRFADHSLDNHFHYQKENDPASAILRYLGSIYAKYGMTLQLHMGANRYTSTRLRKCAGAAGGYASAGNSVDIASLTSFLDDVEQSDCGLPKVILFVLNPADHGMISSLAGSYSKDGVAGLVTQGPAWWWCDHSYGIRSVLENTAAYGLLSNFPGMTTDSRSFLSFARHDYFRRILCNWLAERIMTQNFPKAPEITSQLIYDMCYGNAKHMTTIKK